MMTTRNSTSAQLNGKRLKRYGKYFTIAINVISVAMMIMFPIIAKL